MENLINLIYNNPKVAWLGAILGTLATILGWSNGLLLAVIFVMIADTITGTLAAWKEGRFSSGIRGFGRVFTKLFGYFALVLLAMAVGLAAKDLGTPEIISWITVNSVATLLLTNEAISILENVVALGVPIPQFVKDKLETIKQKQNADSTKSIR